MYKNARYHFPKVAYERIFESGFFCKNVRWIPEEAHVAFIYIRWERKDLILRKSCIDKGVWFIFSLFGYTCATMPFRGEIQSLSSLWFLFGLDLAQIVMEFQYIILDGESYHLYNQFFFSILLLLHYYALHLVFVYSVVISPFLDVSRDLLINFYISDWNSMMYSLIRWYWNFFTPCGFYPSHWGVFHIKNFVFSCDCFIRVFWSLYCL